MREMVIRVSENELNQLLKLMFNTYGTTKLPNGKMVSDLVEDRLEQFENIEELPESDR